MEQRHLLPADRAPNRLPAERSDSGRLGELFTARRQQNRTPDLTSRDMRRSDCALKHVSGSSRRASG
jgi:hypothetical protein